MYPGTLSETVLNPRLVIMIEKNTEPFIVSAAAISSASTVDGAVSPCSPTLKLAGALEKRTMDEDADLPISELLHRLRQKTPSA